MRPAFSFLRRPRASVAALLVGTALGAVPGVAPAVAAETLTLYAAQHEQLVDQLIKDFTARTGIAVKSRFGEAPEIASQILREGSRSPADLFFTENSPELVLLDERGLLAPVDKDTLAAVPAKYSAPDGNWVGVLARENVLAYDPKLIAEDKLPPSLLDLAKPEWQNKVAIAPADADFLPLAEAIARLKDRATAVAWLKAMKRNAKIYDDDEAVVAAVDRGAVPVGIINNYYWARLHQEKGDAGTTAKIHHFADNDVGALVNVSGAAVLKSSKHADAAQKFLAFMTSKTEQAKIAAGSVDFEYPLSPDTAANPVLKPFDQLHPPAITIRELGDDQDAAKMLREAGLL
ncbi:MAG: extracellular solute-binding protein [Gluconacetobacter diazotrophicus]|nr:extracellular solute-binding protein [Gluconacetobacter diazotrophicus]